MQSNFLKNKYTLTIVHAFLFTVVMIVSSYITINLSFSSVPIVLTNCFTLLAGLVLGKVWGTASVILYLFCGAIGLPVFAGGVGGYEHFIGHTGGYLFAYVISTFFVGLICEKKHLFGRDVIALTIGVIILFLVGLPWLKVSLNLTWSQTIKEGMLPFLPGAIIKMVIAFFLAQILRRFVITNRHSSNH